MNLLLFYRVQVLNEDFMQFWLCFSGPQPAGARHSSKMVDHLELDAAAGMPVVGASPVDPHPPPLQGISSFHGHF